MGGRTCALAGLALALIVDLGCMQMTCEGDNLVDKSRLKVFDGDLKVEVALTTTKDIEQLMLSRFLIFRTQEPSFRVGFRHTPL